MLQRPRPYSEELDDVSSFYYLFTSQLSSLIILEVICFLAGFAGLLLNTLVTVFYLPQFRKLYPLMYTANSISDTLLGLASLFTAGLVIQVANNPSEESAASTWLVETVFCLSGVASRTSAFYSVTISVVRVINITRPQYVVSVKGVVVAMVAVVVFWVVFIGVDLWLTLQESIPGDCFKTAGASNLTEITDVFSGSHIEELFLQPLAGKEIYCETVYAIDPTTDPDSSWYKTVQTLILTGIPFFLAAGIAVACLAITAVTLLKTSVGRKSQVSRDITITVLYLTIAFVSCNAPYFVVLLVQGHPALQTSSHGSVFVRLFTSTVFHFINAVLTPLILIMRGTKLREWVVSVMPVSSTSCVAPGAEEDRDACCGVKSDLPG